MKEAIIFAGAIEHRLGRGSNGTGFRSKSLDVRRIEGYYAALWRKE
jgi:hypothetical protein